MCRIIIENRGDFKINIGPLRVLWKIWSVFLLLYILLTIYHISQRLTREAICVKEKVFFFLLWINGLVFSHSRKEEVFLKNLSGNQVFLSLFLFLLVNFSPTKEQFSSKVMKCAAKLLSKKGNWCQAGQLVKKHPSCTTTQLIDVMLWQVPPLVTALLRAPPRRPHSLWPVFLAFSHFSLSSELTCHHLLRRWRCAYRFRPEDGAIIL